MANVSELLAHAESYVERRNIIVDFTANPIGYGMDGRVWKTDRKSVIKCFEYERVYQCELACYLRLQELKVDNIDEFIIPCLVDYDDELWVVEMELVGRPYILDFGKCYLDAAPQHTPEVMNDWDEMYAEMWEGKWPRVKKILWQLKQLGIHYMDPKPGNIRFAAEENK